MARPKSAHYKPGWRDGEGGEHYDIERGSRALAAERRWAQAMNYRTFTDYVMKLKPKE